jgi:hypothetical protein
MLAKDKDFVKGIPTYLHQDAQLFKIVQMVWHTNCVTQHQRQHS